MSPKWKHVLPSLMTEEERERHERKERRGPHIKSRTPKQVKLRKRRKLGTCDDIPRTPKMVSLGKAKAKPYRGHDTATSRSLCGECGEMVAFDTINGQLVALDGVGYARHRHQPAVANTPEANRLRVQRMRESEDA